jgi:phage I-like protein
MIAKKYHQAILTATGKPPRALIFGAMDIAGGKAPAEFELLKTGHWDAYQHPTEGLMSFSVTPAHLIAAERYSALRKERAPNRDFVIDYGHATLKGPDAPASGWIGRIVRSGDNTLIATDVRWTKKAQDAIESGEYRYISPVFGFDILDKVTAQLIPMAVLQAALTNEPFFDELAPLMAAQDNSHLYLFTAKDTNMDELLERLRYFLNLPITATTENVLTELNTLAGQLKESIGAETVQAVNVPGILAYLKKQKASLVSASDGLSSISTVLGLPPGTTLEEIKGRIISGRDNAATITTLRGQLAQIETERFTEKFNGVISAGISCGRITHAQKNDAEWLSAQMDWAKKNFVSCKEHFTQKGPVIVPVSEIRIDESTPPAGQDPSVIAASAVAYKTEQEKLGNIISYSTAVQHVTKGK